MSADCQNIQKRCGCRAVTALPRGFGGRVAPQYQPVALCTLLKMLIYRSGIVSNRCEAKLIYKGGIKLWQKKESAS